LQVVVDADCLIAGTLADRGACAEILDRWQDGDFEIICCPQLLAEVEKALRHPRIAGKYQITPRDVSDLLSRFRADAVFVPDPVSPPRAVPDDRADDYLVALASVEAAAVLVTRDGHFENVEIPEVTILTPGRFLRRLDGRE
jgi:predicted nucleic acid-binding protein